jgi:hypothetical protein
LGVVASRVLIGQLQLRGPQSYDGLNTMGHSITRRAPILSARRSVIAV